MLAASPVSFLGRPYCCDQSLVSCGFVAFELGSVAVATVVAGAGSCSVADGVVVVVVAAAAVVAARVADCA